jgi:hypothetical protein
MWGHPEVGPATGSARRYASTREHARRDIRSVLHVDSDSDCSDGKEKRGEHFFEWNFCEAGKFG